MQAKEISKIHTHPPSGQLKYRRNKGSLLTNCKRPVFFILSCRKTKALFPTKVGKIVEKLGRRESSFEGRPNLAFDVTRSCNELREPQRQPLSPTCHGAVKRSRPPFLFSAALAEEDSKTFFSTFVIAGCQKQKFRLKILRKRIPTRMGNRANKKPPVYYQRSVLFFQTDFPFEIPG